MSQVDELVAEARNALQTGNRLVARGYLRRATGIAPDRLDLWLDLYRVTDLRSDRKRCLVRILELDPENEQAQADLQTIEEQESAEERAAEVEADPPTAALDTEAETGQQAHLTPRVENLIRPDVTDEMRRQWDEAVAAGKPLVCIDHPQRETALRCNRCSAPICTKCAIRTPVGFRCKECIKVQQAAFFNARWHDYPLAALISLVLSVPGAIVAGLAGWWFALIISPLAGGLIGGIVHWAVGRRRGRWLWLLVGACAILGALAALLVIPRAFVPVGIYAVAATGAAIGVLRVGRRR